MKGKYIAAAAVLACLAVGCSRAPETTVSPAPQPEPVPEIQQPLRSCGYEDQLEMPPAVEIVEEPVPEATQEETTPAEDEPAEAAQETEPQFVSLGTFKVTHYCPCKKCCGKDPDHPAYGITATGTVATAGRTIAVDPDVIPYGTEVLVRYEDGTEHTYIAEDCGSAIDGNRLDVFMDSHGAAWDAGIKTAEVFTKEG